MCKPPKPDKPEQLPEPPPPPEEAPVAPVIDENERTGHYGVKRKGRQALRLDLNPAASGAVGAGKTGLAL